MARIALLSGLLASSVALSADPVSHSLRRSRKARDPMALLEAAGADDFGDVGYDLAEDGDDFGEVGAFKLNKAALAHQRQRRATANVAGEGAQSAGVISGALAIGIGATLPLALTSYIPMRIYRVDASAAVTATGIDASGSVVINSFQFANRGLYDGTGTGTLAGFRPDASGRPPIRNIVVYPNTPITINMTNNNAAAVTVNITLYGRT